MCITAPARVLELDATGAIVEIAGLRRRASTLVVPTVTVGDWVIVGAGAILRHLEPLEAQELARTIGTAVAATDAAETTAGGPR
jgi:hydrogenase assembly chaperone HypC/HupF